MTHTHAAMLMRSPVVRYRPWVSDTTWLAHESHPIFGRIAGLLPSNGWWSLKDFKPAKIEGPATDLGQFINAALAVSTTCVVLHGHYERSADFEEAASKIGAIVEVLDADGTVWWFSHDIYEAAKFGGRDWSWRIAPGTRGGKGRLLVAVDRKGRARFLLASIEQEAPTPDDQTPFGASPEGVKP